MTPSGVVRGTIVLGEPGAYDVLPLWRRWGYDHGDGFPGAIRIEVKGGPIVPMPFAASGVAATILAVAAWRRRRPAGRHVVTVAGSQFPPETRTQTRSPGLGR